LISQVFIICGVGCIGGEKDYSKKVKVAVQVKIWQVSQKKKKRKFLKRK
jgi:hypothetical protein